MCNLSQKIKETGIETGIEIGKKEMVCPDRRSA